MSESNSLDVRTLSRIAHDLRGAAGVTSSALDELERAIESAKTDHAMLFRVAKKGVARIVRLAERYGTLAEIEDHPAKTKTDLMEIVAPALRQADAAFGRRNVVVAEATGRGTVNAFARGLGVAIVDATALAITLAKTRVTCAIAEQDGNVTITFEADAPARELCERFASRAFDVPNPIADDETLRFMLLDRIARSHGGDAMIAVHENKTRITLALAAGGSSGGAP